MMLTTARRIRGFTLVELMITVTIAVVLIMIAVPSFKTIILSSKLTTTANDVVGAINLARAEAVKHNGNVQFCSDSATSNTSSTLGTACGTEVGAVYFQTVTPTTKSATQIRSGTVGLTSSLQLSGNAVALSFSGDSLGHKVGVAAPYSGTVMTICTASLTTDNMRVIGLTSGSILDVTNKTGTCP
ncbi:Tfp pilus assembly protein FimT/FimU [Rhodanobacter ginsengisoli]|uniref:Type II secretion system protein H n=1 Tax=Rhodanobacter ginsengisoli TaxID=418646 RepID=A0ABW0QNR2_9GAMM